MSYTVGTSPAARRQLHRLPRRMHQAVQEAIDALAEEPRPRGSIKMTNRDAWRIRVGDYRIIYEVRDRELMIIVITVGHRRDVYR